MKEDGMKYIIGFGLGIFFMIFIAAMLQMVELRTLENRAVALNFAKFNENTGKLYYIDKKYEYLITGINK